MRGHLVKVVAACAVACLLFAGTASAAAPYTTKVTISKFSPTWHGTVISTRFGGVRSCERKRIVKVYKRRAGKDKLIGTDLSSRSGRWAVPDEPTKGIYIAKVIERRAGGEPACLGDYATIEVGG